MDRSPELEEMIMKKGENGTNDWDFFFSVARIGVGILIQYQRKTEKDYRDFLNYIEQYLIRDNRNGHIALKDFFTFVNKMLMEALKCQ